MTDRSNVLAGIAQLNPAPMPSTLSARIVAQVREALFDGNLHPGDRLGSEAELSQRFGVSRMAARDALKHLEASGIVEIRAGAGGGARIASGNPQLFANSLAIQLHLMQAGSGDIMQVQRAIEMMAAELATDNASEADLDKIAGLLDQAEAQIDDVEGFTQLSFAFHLAVADAAHNDVLRMLLISMRHIAWPSKNQTLTPEVARHVLALHREIYVLLRARDGDGARDLMSRHLKQIRARRVAEDDSYTLPPACC